MATTGYNGWTNYETWVVKLWLDNDGTDLEEMARECLRDAIDKDQGKDDATICLRDQLEAYVDDLQELVNLPTTGMFADLLGHALGMVDWREIADNVMGDIPVYVAGVNVPGHMPDNTPAAFLDADDARNYIASEMRMRAESFEDRTDPECLSDACLAGDYSIPDGNAQNLRDAADHLDTLSTEGGAAEFGITLAGTHYFIHVE